MAMAIDNRNKSNDDEALLIICMSKMLLILILILSHVIFRICTQKVTWWTEADLVNLGKFASNDKITCLCRKLPPKSKFQIKLNKKLHYRIESNKTTAVAVAFCIHVKKNSPKVSEQLSLHGSSGHLE